MYKFMVALLLVGMFSLAASAQEMGTSAPKAEVFGGYQYTRFDGGNANGWDTAVTTNLNNWFGIGGDFSGAYMSQTGVGVNTYTYTFGPVVSYRHGGKVTPFAHFLLGGFHSTASAFGVSASDGGFAMMLGGGFDMKATQHIALRAIQFDWLSLHSNGVSDNNNMRIATGIVFRY